MLVEEINISRLVQGGYSFSGSFWKVHFCGDGTTSTGMGGSARKRPSAERAHPSESLVGALIVPPRPPSPLLRGEASSTRCVRVCCGGICHPCVVLVAVGVCRRPEAPFIVFFYLFAVLAADQRTVYPPPVAAVAPRVPWNVTRTGVSAARPQLPP